MTTESVHAAKFARELEAQLEDFPDERGEILTEAAGAWHRAGDHDRAIELLTEVVALGGENGGNAQVQLADVLFALDRPEEARASLDALRKRHLSSPMPYHLAAELLEERAEYAQALTWFTMAASRLIDRDGAGPLSYANTILAGRRRVRRVLEMPPDELDESVQEFSDDVDELDPALSPAVAPREVHVLFWLREEVGRAHETWPGLVEHADADTIVREREAANRELSDSGVARIVMVPLTTAKLIEFAARTGGDPVDEDTRMACLEEIVEQGGALSWPPARNAACWCGSAAKYKKCCGRPV